MNLAWQLLYSTMALGKSVEQFKQRTNDSHMA
jgi:hypothetical protein